VVPVCTRCGQESPDGFRFCGSCGAELGGGSAPSREERKVVSVLFCDLVGYTAAAQAADPEDVSRILGAYHAAVRTEIERFGGVVEKFIGDAAVGVWGAPVAHEDDAERAVRAAFGILGAVDADVRVAVNTGEVLVRLDPRLDSGVGVVGDVVNTASRLQAFAPVGGVVVGEGTVRATGGTIEYENLEPAMLKGKPEPVAVWQAVAARTGSGERRETSATPFVGRQTELELLRRVYERTLAEPGLQLITIVGEPGVGKSRLVAELERWLAVHQASPVVRRGRCLAYGDGIGFWPLAEIIKAQLGIGEADTEDEARTKLQLGVEGMMDAPWLRARLAPLVGLPGDAGERQEVFTAWQRFLDETAERAALVLVVEDIHWADPAMLAFLRHLAEWSSGVPMLLACTTRPELLEAHAGWGGDLVNATTVAVRPLNHDDTATLAHALLVRIRHERDTTATLVNRCGGNPLYAEEYARLLTDRAVSASADMAMPDTVQALIAARIDTLPAERKALLHEAAVIGKVFWAGALAAIGDRDPADVRAHLHELARKELVRRVRISTVPGEEEYGFWHDLVHDVAYAQIPRARRAVLHRRTAEWIEHVAESRIRDRAELLAYHYVEALSLARAIGEADDEQLRRAAVRHLATAGEQAVDIERAAQLLRSGLDLSVPEDEERAKLFTHLALCEIESGRLDTALPLLRDARAAAEASGDLHDLAQALTQELWFAAHSGDRHSLDKATANAVQRLESEPPTAESAELFATAAQFAATAEDMDTARTLAEHALTTAEEVGDLRVAGLAIAVRGMARAIDGDRRGLDDLDSALVELRGTGVWVSMAQLSLADCTLIWDGPDAATQLFLDAIDYDARIASPIAEMWTRGENVWRLADQGAWDELLVEANRVFAWATDHDLPQHMLLVAPHKARVLALRGDTIGARQAMTGILDHARRVRDPQMLAPTLAASALIEALDRNTDAAHQRIDELGADARSPWAPTAEICRLLIALREHEAARSIVDGITRGPPRLTNAVPSVRAMLAEAVEDHTSAADHYHEAAARWRTYGHAYELGHALAGEARCMAALGHIDQAAPTASEAASIIQHLGVRGRAVPSLPS
jgi:class 3 adenylate cyclase